MADVRVEVPAENTVLEILYDGTEIHQKPASMSDHLTQLARKVDFGAADGEDLASEDKPEEEEEEKPFQQPHWIFEGVRNKIRNSLTEVCVLHDLLQIVRERHYLVLDSVQAPVPDAKLHMLFLALKKSMNSAASILLNGAERLRAHQTEFSRSRQAPDFHIELLRLRQNWRLKKVGHTILGDLSYRTAGSQFKHLGMFEVSKADDIGPVQTSALVPGGRTSPMIPPQPQRPQPTSSLKVTIPPELEGYASILICIRKDEEDLSSFQYPSPPVVPKDTHWQQKLEQAQNVLFCRELFSQLAREAVRLKPSIPHFVVGNQITATIFPGIHLVIVLRHSDAEGTSHKKQGSVGGPVSGTGCSGSVGSSGMGTSGTTAATSSSGCANVCQSQNYEEVLEHSLHQLLHRSFNSFLQMPLPHPVYGPVGVLKKRRVAGPEGTDRNQILQTTKNETLLEQIIRQAQHNFLRLRTMYVIDQLATEYKDPLIVSHWNVFNSPVQSCVKVNIITQGYDAVTRTSLAIHVYERSLKCVCRDGKVMTMSFEPQELRNLMLCQISQHNMAAVQSFAKLMGWTVISSENNIGVGATEPLGNASVVMLGSPVGNKVLAVRSSPITSVSVMVASSPRNDFYPSAVVSERRWEHLSGAWREVRLDRMEGRNFLNKIEYLMAALTAQT